MNAEKTKSARGPVLKPMSLASILKFTGGDMSTVIDVSKRSLLDAKTKNDRDNASKVLNDL